ncbi:phage major capsid protein [Mycobacteroides chelonae]|uniref:phage major capsid protein n=1 Tax=Mycobacteroides chelonae TaxID=1774 RepID=UPI0018B01707|nr:phage major capsid protein [Mycobacteroides chelonae]MBF9325926.1 phage major capsid protein [Mycobacteroides chelonae]MBF9420102.1 phage major capsid protein [Mycobacteroides chelonae]
MLGLEEFLSSLQDKRDAERHAAQRIVDLSRRAGRKKLTGEENHDFLSRTANVKALTDRIADVTEDIRRAGGDSETLTRLRRGTTAQLANLVAPLSFPPEQVREAFERISRGADARLITRNTFSSADSLLPAQLWPQPLFPLHDSRILDRLPAFAMDAPSVEYVQVTGVTGAAAIVAEGAQKPEISYTTAKVVATAAKIAAHAGVSWEIIQDWHTFYDYLQQDLAAQVVQAENTNLLNGSGAITGFLQTSGILTLAPPGSPPDGWTAIDQIEQAITALRTGSSFATADLLILNPATWSAIRRLKDTTGRLLFVASDSDPSAAEANRIFNVPVLQTTALAAGAGVLLDSTKFGRALVREPMSIRIGYDGNDFTHNILRSIAEERLTLAVERPSAVLSLTGLPTS